MVAQLALGQVVHWLDHLTVVDHHLLVDQHYLLMVDHHHHHCHRHHHLVDLHLTVEVEEAMFGAMKKFEFQENMLQGPICQSRHLSSWTKVVILATVTLAQVFIHRTEVK